MNVSALRNTGITLALLAAIAAPAHANVIGETEPNDTLAAPQVVPQVAGDPITTINGARTFADPSDDFYRFMVPAFTNLRITSTSSDPFADSILGLYGPAGLLVASNDDANGTFMSALNYFVTGVGGLFTIGFSGYNPGLLACGGGVTACYDTDGDFLFDTFVAGGGAGGSTGWTYALTIERIAAVPEPGVVVLLGIGLAGLTWSRSRARKTASPGIHA